MIWKFTLYETKNKILLAPDSIIAIQESKFDHPYGLPWRVYFITLCTAHQFEVESFVCEIDRIYLFRNSFGDTIWQLPSKGRGRTRRALMKQ